MGQSKKDSQARCWFVTINNPEKNLAELGLPANSTPEQVVDWCLEHWMEAARKGKENERGAGCCYEVGDQGTPHVHMACCAKSKPRFSYMKKVFPPADLRMARGTSEEITNYLSKTGRKENEEKAHTQIVAAKFIGMAIVSDKDMGEFPGEGKKNIFNEIDGLLLSGKRPADIYAMHPKYAFYANSIERTYMARKQTSVPAWRDLTVIYHTGKEGSGKSWNRMKYEESCPEDIHVVSGMNWNHPWDAYSGQKIVFFDEFRSQIKYNELLTLLDGYRLELPARYGNKFAAWEVVEIASVIPPELLYFKEAIGSTKEQEVARLDNVRQLMRRITEIQYHYKNPYLEGDEQYQYLTFTPDEWDYKKAERMAAEKIEESRPEGAEPIESLFGVPLPRNPKPEWVDLDEEEMDVDSLVEYAQNILNDS